MTELVVLTSDDQATLVILEQSRAVLTLQETATAILVPDQTTVHTQTETPSQAILAGFQGPVGGIGPTGQSAVPSVHYIAGQTVGGHRAVYISSGLVFYASNNDSSADAVLGVTLGAANTGQSVEIRYVGVVTEPSWNWTPGDPVYLGLNGMITQSAPSSGAVVELGVALTATSINVRIQEAVFLN